MILPTTTKPSEELIYARRWVAYFRETGTPWSDESALTPDASRAVLRHLLHNAAEMHPMHRLDIIARARAGDRDADNVLRAMILEADKQNQPLPSELFAYRMEIVNSNRNPQPPARKKKNNMLRNIVITLTVGALCDHFGLQPTGGHSARQRSACSFVAEALGEASIQMGDKAIEAVWAEWRGMLPVVPGWSASWDSMIDRLQ
jgi:hypothetical protein